MSSHSTHQHVIRAYTGQPEAMPSAVRERLESLWRGRPVQLYALVDLGTGFDTREDWLALGPDHVALVTAGDDPAEPQLTSVARADIGSVEEIPGLSSTRLNLIGRSDGRVLLSVRYSHRQRQAVGAIVFVLKQQLEGVSIKLEAAAGSPDELYAANIAQPVLEAQALVSRHRLAVVWRLLSYLRPYRRQVVIGSIGAVLMTLVSLAPPFLTGYVIDHVIRPFEDGSIDAATATRLAMAVLAGIAAVYGLRELFGWIRLRWMAVLGEHVARDLRTHVYDHLHKLSVSYFSSKQTGSIISRVSSDTDRIWDFIAFGVVEVSLSLIMLFGLGAVLIWLDWPLGLLMTLPIPLLLYALVRNSRRMQRYFLRAWRKWSDLTDVLSDTVPGIRVVKAFHQEDRERERFNRRNRTVTDEFFRIHHIWTGFWPLLLLAVHVLTITVWAVALPRILHGGPEWMPALTPGTFVSFLLYTTMFFQPIEVFGQMTRMLNRALTSAHRIFEVLDTEPAMQDQPDPVRLEPVRGHVVFDSVTFGYDPVRLILKGVSFEVQPGEMIGLVGPSGAGKTTVTNLIARFYDATGGAIRIDGVPIGDLDSGHYRKQIGMVLQDPYLFHGTILENIRYGMREASIDEVVAAARAANAHEFIGRLPHGYDTVVGERGHTLSGGERQRISIARAVLHNPRLLILDEATSSVDTETEKRIQEALDRLIEGRTTFAIAHRLSTLTRASRLFVFKDGRLVEQGTHRELLGDPDGVYHGLHRIQRDLHDMYAV